MNIREIHDCLNASFANTPFPIVVARLTEAGVHTYRADLIRLRKAYYGDGTATEEAEMPLADAPAIAAEFDAAKVESTLRAIQGRKIGYADFLRGIMAAGCANYVVYMKGKRVDYIGRDGQTFTEYFPGAKP
jgi:uncharacterized protein YbcV (DUF1398 family)